MHVNLLLHPYWTLKFFKTSVLDVKSFERPGRMVEKAVQLDSAWSFFQHALHWTPSQSARDCGGEACRVPQLRSFSWDLNLQTNVISQTGLIGVAQAWSTVLCIMHGSRVANTWKMFVWSNTSRMFASFPCITHEWWFQWPGRHNDLALACGCCKHLGKQLG